MKFKIRKISEFEERTDSSVNILKFNLDTFPVKNKILLVTGISGSGKTTYGNTLADKYNGIFFDLDWTYTTDDLIPDSIPDNIIKAVFEKNNITYEMVNEDSFSDEEYTELLLDVFEVILDKYPDNVFIVVGNEIFADIPIDKFKSVELNKYPIILLDISLEESAKRQYQRFIKTNDPAALTKEDYDENSQASFLEKTKNREKLKFDTLKELLQKSK